MKTIRTVIVFALFLLSGFQLMAQNQPMTPEQQEKKLMESVDKEVKRLSDLLALEDWQEFYVDSILNHDLHARAEEMLGMQKAKVENPDLYQAVNQKWMDQIESAYRRYFTEEQWAKYAKSTGKRAKKERDKRKK